MNESVNHHQKHADALKCAMEALKRINAEFDADSEYDEYEDMAKVMSMIAAGTLRDIERILK